MSAGGDEFDLIARHFAPLATHAGARGLQDDVALLSLQGTLVITTDAVVEGVHFRAADPLDRIARKALRVNLSDLAAKGARPLGYLVSLCWPDGRSAAGVAEFAAGLAEDQAIFGCALLGGDTTRTPGPLTIAITAFGAPFGARTPARADAQVGDDLWVTGTIGDGYLGLAVLEGRFGAGETARLIRRYQLPEPRMAFAPAVAAFATAAMDVSDGLLGDAAKIAAASGVALRIDPGAIPLSAEAAAWLARQPDPTAARAALANGGDDYEILFTAPSGARGALAEAAAEAGLPVARIGSVQAGRGVDAGGLPVGGHVHRLGRQ